MSVSAEHHRYAMPRWRLRCARCGAAAPCSEAGHPLACGDCGDVTPCEDGIYRCLPADQAPLCAERAAHFPRFIPDAVSPDDAAFYLSLPEIAQGHPAADTWFFRMRTWHKFTRSVLPKLGRGLRVVDCGAGTGWASARLRELGHFPCAVDLRADAREGLAAARHFHPDWPRLQADFDALPLPDACADLLLFNASLHYAADYPATLRESLRVLAPGGCIAVLDTPIFFHTDTGARLRAERDHEQPPRFDTPPRIPGAREYIDMNQIIELERSLGIVFDWHWVFYSLRWTRLRWRIAIRDDREPVTYAILIIQRL